MDQLTVLVMSPTWLLAIKQGHTDKGDIARLYCILHLHSLPTTATAELARAQEWSAKGKESEYRH